MNLVKPEEGTSISFTPHGKYSVAARLTMVYWGWPTRVADMTNNVGKTRVPTAKYESFKSDMSVILSSLKAVDIGQIPKNGCATLDISLCGGVSDFFVTKKGVMTPKKIDADNRIKSIQDCIFKAIGADDSMVYKVSCRKCPHISMVGKEHERKFTIVELAFFDEPDAYVFTP